MSSLCCQQCWGHCTQSTPANAAAALAVTSLLQIARPAAAGRGASTHMAATLKSRRPMSQSNTRCSRMCVAEVVKAHLDTSVLVHAMSNVALFLFVSTSTKDAYRRMGPGLGGCKAVNSWKSASVFCQPPRQPPIFGCVAYGGLEILAPENHVIKTLIALVQSGVVLMFLKSKGQTMLCHTPLTKLQPNGLQYVASNSQALSHIR